MEPIPEVVPRKVVEKLLGEALRRENYFIETAGRDLRVEYIEQELMLKAHWIITLSDGGVIMVLDT
jgi:hypothetical protein